LFADCMPEPNDGSFEFSTYNRGDGIPQGSYIALFLDMPTSWGGGYKGDDLFKNRFNDPGDGAVPGVDVAAADQAARVPGGGRVERVRGGRARP